MENRTRRRFAALALGSAAAAVVVGMASPAYAVVGGDVIRHDSIQNLVIAKDIQFTNGTKGSTCHIWNRDGGNTWNYVNAHNNCTTASMNGRTYSWTVWNDTDAFTMQYESYWVSMHGSWRHISANDYTRIHDDENVHCYRESDGVNCYVSYG